MTCFMEGETHRNSYRNKNAQQDKVNDHPNGATCRFEHKYVRIFNHNQKRKIQFLPKSN